MNPLTLEWINKAEGDFATSKREYRVRKVPNYDAVCFHAQQAAEKYIKAFLQEHDLEIPRTHNLTELVFICRNVQPEMQLLSEYLNFLDGFAVNYRYPGISAERSDAKIAIHAIEAVRDYFKSLLV